MGDPSTAMRDPVFYRWHQHVDEVFNIYKAKLPVYEADRVTFNCVHI